VVGSVVPSIVTDGTFKIYVYAKDHNPPHCHIYWERFKVAVVYLNPISLGPGDRLPRSGLRLVIEHIDELLEAWQRLNP
jgi:hypothetical protein